MAWGQPGKVLLRYAAVVPLHAAPRACPSPSLVPALLDKLKLPLCSSALLLLLCVWVGATSAQVRVEEELAFIDGSAIFRRIMATGASWAGPGSSNPAEAAGAAEAADVDMGGSR